MKINNKYIQHLLNLIWIFTLLLMIFTRSFVGIRFLGFRIGELLVGFGLFLIISFGMLSYFSKKSFSSLFPWKYFLIVILSFVITLIYSEGNPFSLYTYKSSSYLWMIGYFFIGYLTFTNLKFTNFHFYSLCITPIVIYFINSGNYPNFIIDFFKKYSDKFQFTKGSDVLIALIFSSLILKGKFKNEFNYLTYINIISFTTLPLFLTLSRASFFAGCLFIVSLNVSFLFIIKENKKKFTILFILSMILFILSAIRLAAIPDIDLRSEEPVILQVVGDSISEVADRKSTFKFLGFYACEDRICAEDNTLDWRFDIWNDLVRDQISKNKLFLGFGFNEIFEIMKDPQAPGRLGREGLNEHVHNHLFTIVGRMGLIGFFVYLLFQYKLINQFGFNFITFLFPLFLVSMIDTTMESVQFPYLLYFLISYRKAYFNNEIGTSYK
jgi:hypothetical protein